MPKSLRFPGLSLRQESSNFFLRVERSSRTRHALHQCVVGRAPLQAQSESPVGSPGPDERDKEMQNVKGFSIPLYFRTRNTVAGDSEKGFLRSRALAEGLICRCGRTCQGVDDDRLTVEFDDCRK
jgi:hypothetical protein